VVSRGEHSIIIELAQLLAGLGELAAHPEALEEIDDMRPKNWVSCRFEHGRDLRVGLKPLLKAA
jgi:hypothetical protein